MGWQKSTHIKHKRKNLNYKRKNDVNFTKEIN